MESRKPQFRGLTDDELNQLDWINSHNISYPHSLPQYLNHIVAHLQVLFLISLVENAKTKSPESRDAFQL